MSNPSRYNFTFWQPQPEIVIFDSPGTHDTITNISAPDTSGGGDGDCGYFSDSQNPEYSDYYDFNGNYYQNMGFSEWYDSNNDYTYYSMQDLPDYCDNLASDSAGTIIIPTPYTASDTKFTLVSDSQPSDYNDYGYFGFSYKPFLKVDKTIENGLGYEFEVYSIAYEAYYLGRNGVFVKYISGNTYSVTKDYDTVTDKYIIYPNTEFYISSDMFKSILFVVTYDTNAGTITKHQTVDSYDSNDNYAYPVGLFTSGTDHIFYIPLRNEQLKSIKSIESKLYDVTYDGVTGRVSAKTSLISDNELTAAIKYSTSKRNNEEAWLNVPYGNTIAKCGTINVAYGGYVGYTEYGITIPNGTGMLEFLYMNYTLPDRFAIRVNSQVKYDTIDYRKHANRVHIPITSPIVGSAGLKVYTNNLNTSWVSSLGCVNDYTTYTPGLTFSFNNEYTKSDILVLSSDGISYTQAKEGIDYEFTSVLSPTENLYTALSTISILLTNEKIIGKVGTRYVYTDPYTSLPVHHTQIKLEYPNKTVIGNDPLHPDSGDIRITRLELHGSFASYTVNVDSGSMKKYVPLCNMLACITGVAPQALMGNVSYIKDSQTYDQVLLVREYGEDPIYILDPMTYLFVNGGITAENYKYTGNTFLLPSTVPSSGWGYYYNDTVPVINNEITLPFAQPFYGNTTGYKYFQTSLYGDGDPGAVLSRFKLNITDDVSSYSTIIDDVPIDLPARYVFTKYNCYTTSSMTMTISGCNKESFFLSTHIQDIVAELSPGQSYPSPQSWTYLRVKKDLTYGSHAYTQAVENVDYSYSGGNIVAINSVSLLSTCLVNPLIT